MRRDLLLLLEHGVTDPAHPGERFLCPDDAGSANGHRFVDHPRRLLDLLAQRHGLARVH